MAYFTFTDIVWNNKPEINIYSKKLLRDFTYIKDIVNGIILSLNKGYKLSVFNLGRDHPRTVNDLVNIIFKNSQIKNIKINTSITYGAPSKITLKSEVKHTFANISIAKKNI